MTSTPPAITYGNGDIAYYNAFGVLHRDDDEPAYIYSYGRKVWWRNGRKHRDNNQPAVVHADGTKEWWVDGVRQLDPVQPPQPLTQQELLDILAELEREDL